MTNDYRMTQNWGGQNPQSPTTGHYQAAAGRGPTERQQRAMAARQPIQPPPKVISPLAGLGEAKAFVDEVRPPQRNVAERMVVGGVLAAALVRAVQNRRNR